MEGGGEGSEEEGREGREEGGREREGREGKEEGGREREREGSTTNLADHRPG